MFRFDLIVYEIIISIRIYYKILCRFLYFYKKKKNHTLSTRIDLFTFLRIDIRLDVCKHKVLHICVHNAYSFKLQKYCK